MVKITSAQRIQKLRGRRLADLGFDVKKNWETDNLIPRAIKKR